MATISTHKRERRQPARGLRGVVRDLAIRAGVLPTIHRFGNPLKTQEFWELMRLARLQRNDRVLDFGCGIGSQSWILGRRVQSLVGVDINEQAVQQAREAAQFFGATANCEFRAGDLLDLRLDANFTKVLSFCVIEHVDNAKEVVAEWHRLLESGGEVILSADSLARVDDRDFVERHRQRHHVVQYFTPQTLRELLEEAGFEVLQLYSILNSDLAHRWFMSEGMVPLGLVRSAAYAYRLALWERLSRRKEDGLFLVARARKKA